MSLASLASGRPATTLYVALGARRAVGAVLAGTGSRARWLEPGRFEVHWADAEQSAHAPLDRLLAMLQTIRPADAMPAVGQIRVVVADNWLALAGMPWSAGAVRSDEADARAHLAREGFEVEPVDTIRLEDGPYGQPRLAVAYPARLLLALRQVASRFSSRLTSVLPLSVVAWEAAQASAPAEVVAVVDAGLMMFLRARGAGRHIGAVSVQARRCSLQDEASDVRAIWQRLCLREPQLAAAGSVALLNLAESGPATPDIGAPFVAVRLPASVNAVGVSPVLHLAVAAGNEPRALDALPAAAPQTVWRWAALAMAVLLAGAATLQAVRSNRAVEQLAARLTVLTGSVRPAFREVGWSREELARVQAVNAAIRQLNVPIAALVRALQPPADIRVAVLSMETSDSSAPAGSSSVKIVAEARNGADMTRYVAYVAERTPFTDAYLIRHEIDETVAERPYRFTVEARWTD